MREYKANMSRNDDINDPKLKKLELCTSKVATITTLRNLIFSHNCRSKAGYI